MKKYICLAILLTAGCFAVSSFSAEESSPKYEYAVVKWDGPDRLYYNLPKKFELVYLSKIGITVPKDAQNEEFCLAVAANIMAKDGWEPINLDSRRILFRRPAAK